jgi:DNA replication and repair protein RecF
MSIIQRLNVSGVRNIHQLNIEPSTVVNILYGENGSGKTSVLESIHLLASGRSFRTNKLDLLINNAEGKAVVFAALEDGSEVGLSKTRRKGHQLKFCNEKQRNWENVARELPVQTLNSNSFLLLEGGPKPRRQFLDWGVFHVEQSFIRSWRRTKKSIANRNLLLKHRKPDWEQINAWDSELNQASHEVDAARNSYFDSFLPLFMETYEDMGGADAGLLKVSYDRGWDPQRPLSELLVENKEIDARYGATQNGPHRADLLFKIGQMKAVEILSRGQQKILVSAMKIAQGVLLSRALDKGCIFLVDDLPSELDLKNRTAVLRRLLDLGGQVFITCVEISAILDALPMAPKMTKFHVERGTITA